PSGRFVLYSDPEAIREIFTGDPDQLRAGEANQILDSFLGSHSLLRLDGARHQRERRLMMPPFHGERMRAYGALMQKITDSAIDAWPLDQPFAILPEMQKITLEVILRAVFGLEEGAHNQLRELLRQILDRANNRLALAALFVLPAPLLRRLVFL